MEILSAVSKELGMNVNELRRLAEVAPKKYKVYTIPKRQSGFRLIAQPTSEIKRIQRAVVKLLASRLIVHDAAQAYKISIGIKDNAKIHMANPYLLKMDFQNFFNKIKPILLFDKLKSQGVVLSYEDRRFLEGILFWKPGKKRSITLVLSVGAPSSPFISNFVMYDFDAYISNWCTARSISYSRYADDITFSTDEKNVLFEVPKTVRYALSLCAKGISLNESKTVFTSKAHNRHVTGVTLTVDGELSLGRHKKRVISSMLHQYTLGILPKEDVMTLKGFVGHALYIEPKFIVRMKIKYGKDIIHELFSEEGM
ncbi:retron St85 family RNA-directed DNA polymerase [Klebsiella michiganensis]|uniref:retron St85 family RNA-directed DNA polymerase n=1 Tax=Klebsiella michiganensis TaxID=1134687 RepID=UPI0032DB9C15